MLNNKDSLCPSLIAHSKKKRWSTKTLEDYFPEKMPLPLTFPLLVNFGCKLHEKISGNLKLYMCQHT